MKKIYIAPVSYIEVIHLQGSVLDDPGIAEYSNTAKELGTNSFSFDEEDSNTNDANPNFHNLWDD